jgi:hypothetical protein
MVGPDFHLLEWLASILVPFEVALASALIVDHLRSELQEVEAQLVVLYERRDGLQQVLGVAVEDAPEEPSAGPRLCYTNPLSVARCPRGHASCGICERSDTCEYRLRA